VRIIAPRIVGLAAAGVFVVACSLTSLGGFSGGDGAATDGGATDGRSDAPTEGGVDAGMDGASPRFCETLSPPATFCDDFERADLVGAWGMREVYGGATLDIRTSTRSA